jgi:hypothetical protein
VGAAGDAKRHSDALNGALQRSIDEATDLCESGRMTHRINVPEVLRGYSRALVRDFEEHERQLNQATDRGAPRESGVRGFLADRLPGRYGIGEGFVMDRTGALSAQSDVVVFDRERMPRIELHERGRLLFPCECVYATVEVKSRLTADALSDAVQNIASFKRLIRDEHDTVAMPGFIARDVSSLNPRVGILVAHAYGDDLEAKSGDKRLELAVKEIIGKVPRAQQLDLVLVLGRDLYMRGATHGKNFIIDFAGDEFVRMRDLKDDALATFLLATTTLLNGIELGDCSMLRYLPLLWGRQGGAADTPQ